jgi:cytochrome c-type biogenesis protein CcsB
MLFNIENFIENIAFCLLFLTMLFYWIAIGAVQTSKMILIARGSILLSNASLFLFLLLRWKESGHFPLSNLYESLIFLSWSLTVIQIVIETKNATNFIIRQFNSLAGKDSAFSGAIIAPSALLTYAFATFSLPMEMQKTSALVPALQSNWLVMHVTIMILSYAALICGCLLSIAFLIITSKEDEAVPSTQSNLVGDGTSSPNNISNNIILNSTLDNSIGVNSLKSTNLSSSIGITRRKVPFFSEAFFFSLTKKTVNRRLTETKMSLIAKNLDNLSYRILGIGFPLLTIGILSGSVWANEAWGSYWSWDPKETWALLTWLVFAIYLHTRLTKGWEGRKPAIIASFGFIIVWICFIGVNLLGKGLHSYGWLS